MTLLSLPNLDPTTLQSNLAWLGIAIIFLTTVISIGKSFIDPLSAIPGPWIASFTNIWRLRNALSGREEDINLELHENYGPIVRAGPTTVYVVDPESLSKIYRWNRPRNLGALLESLNIQQLIGDADMKLHEKYRHAFKAPVGPSAWRSCFNLSLPSILQHEAAIDELLERWFQKLQLQHGQGHICDLAMWINLLPPDIGSFLLWSESVGLIEKGEDTANLVYGVATFQAAALVAFILPWIPGAFSAIGLDPLMRWSLKYVKSMSFIIELATSVVSKKLDEKDAECEQDVVQKLIDYRDRDGKGFPRERLNAEVYGLLLGASSTTAAVLKSAVIFVATDPRVLNKLLKELDEVEEKGLLSPILQHKETVHLPYLTAILNETLRLRPPQSFPIPREVPKGGAEICGYYLPEFTHVGISPWSFQARRDLFGPDVRSFRPERWLEDEKHARLLQKSASTFGGGSTSCVGKHVADVQLNKILAELFRRYTVVVQDPLRPAKKTSCGGIDYSHLMVSLVPRER